MCYPANCGEGACASCTMPQNEVLKGLDIQHLTQLDEAKDKRSYQSGEIIHQANRYTNGIWCVSSGLIALMSPEDDGIMDVYTTGEYIVFGDFFGEELVPIELVALTEAKVCLIPFQQIDHMLHDNIHFTRKLLKQTAKKYTQAIEFNTTKSKLPMEPRLAYVLSYIATKVPIDSNGVLKTYLKRKVWASLSNMNIANVIRTFTKLDRQGLIQLDGKSISIPNQALLQDFVGEHIEV